MMQASKTVSGHVHHDHIPPIQPSCVSDQVRNAKEGMINHNDNDSCQVVCEMYLYRQIEYVNVMSHVHY